MPRLLCGTSGFAYPAWKPEFYPPKLAAKDFLKHYATRLNAVEINDTFRRLPSASTLEGWVKATPAGFVFCVKAHQRITHIQRLKDSEFTEVFFRAIDPLRSAGRLGTVLFQTPPNLKCDAGLLEGFLAHLPEGYRCAFEFRNPGWLVDPVYRLLEKHSAALCLAESDKLEIPEVFTAGFVHSRLRKSDYTPEERDDVKHRARANPRSRARSIRLLQARGDSGRYALYAEELIAAFPA